MFETHKSVNDVKIFCDIDSLIPNARWTGLWRGESDMLIIEDVAAKVAQNPRE